MTQSIFFLGKGGVGKSTISAITALQESRRGKQVLLISLDPAHNQSDIFNLPLGDKPARIRDGLEVLQIDHNSWIKRYLLQIERKLKSTYQYLSAFNLENHFNIIRFSPGIEEYALILAYDFYTRRNVQKDFLIFDMPPTALALKFFNLPQLSILWLDKLLQLRQEIIKKREIISKIKFGQWEYESDKVINNLREQRDLYSKINNRLHDKDRTELKLVMNTDNLSLAESGLIMNRLQEVNFSVSEVIVNKFENETPEFAENLKSIIKKYYPTAPEPLIGLSALERYLEQSEALQRTN